MKPTGAVVVVHGPVVWLALSLTACGGGEDSPLDSVLTRAENMDMEITVSKSTKDQGDQADLVHWLRQSMASRIAAVEQLRLQLNPAPPAPDAEPRLQRVCRVTRRRGG